MSHEAIGGRAFQTAGTASAKTLRQQLAVCFQGLARRPV